MRASIVGTSIAWVILSRRTVASHSPAENAGRYTTRRPV